MVTCSPLRIWLWDPFQIGLSLLKNHQPNQSKFPVFGGLLSLFVSALRDPRLALGDAFGSLRLPLAFGWGELGGFFSALSSGPFSISSIFSSANLKGVCRLFLGGGDLANASKKVPEINQKYSPQMAIS